MFKCTYVHFLLKARTIRIHKNELHLSSLFIEMYINLTLINIAFLFRPMLTFYVSVSSQEQ